MRKFSSHKKTNKIPEKGIASDKIAGKIAGAALRLQTTCAVYVNSLLIKMTPRKLKAGLVVFCIAGGGFSIYLVAKAIAHPVKNAGPFNGEQLVVPRQYDHGGEEAIRPGAYVDEQMMKEIERFKLYMDSLKQTGNHIYDSIGQARPGLMDSVRMLEEVYHSQTLK